MLSLSLKQLAVVSSEGGACVQGEARREGGVRVTDHLLSLVNKAGLQLAYPLADH